MNRVVYNDFAPLADQNATVPAVGSSDCQSGGELLNEEKRNILNFASFESRGIDLTDSALSFAENGDNLGFVSSAISGGSRKLSPAVELIIELSGGVYSAPGITFHFWQHYCSDVTVKWLNNSELLSEKTFYPTSLNFYGENAVDGFNKIIIDFAETETAFQFVKLAGIDLGQTIEITDFYSDIEIFTEISPDCSDVPAATCDFTAEIPDFSPERAQALYVYRNDKLYGKFIVDNVTSSGKDIFNFECSDDNTRLDGSLFPELSQGSCTAAELAEKIKSASNITIDTSSFGSMSLTGFIEADKTSRLAAAMLSFGTGCFLTGYGSKSLRLIKPTNKRQAIISSDRILGYAEYKKNSAYSKIIICSFSDSFNNMIAQREYSNAAQKANDINGEKIYNQYSLISDIDGRIAELKESGFEFNEVNARIELEDEKPGDILSVETPYNGVITGIIKSMQINIGHKVTAEITLIERGYAANGGEA